MNIYKFVIPDDKYIPLASEDQQPGSNTEVSGRLAVVLAESEAAARELAAFWMEQMGYDARWLKVSPVVVLPIDKPKFVAYTQT
jgi:hypothetical protein